MTVPNTSFSNLSNLRPRSVSYHPSFRYRFFLVTFSCRIPSSNFCLPYSLLKLYVSVLARDSATASTPIPLTGFEWSSVLCWFSVQEGTRFERCHEGRLFWLIFFTLFIAPSSYREITSNSGDRFVLFFTIHYLLILPALDATWSDLWNISSSKPNKCESL